MNRRQKENAVADLSLEFKQTAAAFLVGCKGMTSTQAVQLRKQLKERNSSLCVAKVTLIRRVAESFIQAQQLKAHLKNQIAVVFAHSDPVATAKLLQEYSKNVSQLQVLCGLLNDVVIDAASVKQLSQLPSKEVLRARVCGALKSPIVNTVGVLRNLLLKTVLVLKAIEENKASKLTS